MHRPTRRTLPAVAAAAFLALTGCGGDAAPRQDGHPGGEPAHPAGPGATAGSGSPGSARERAGAKEEPGGPTPRPAASSGDPGGASPGPREGRVPDNEELAGSWYVGYAPEDPAIDIEPGTPGESAYAVTYYEDTDPRGEGDVCHGAVDRGQLDVTCDQIGESLWPDTHATVTLVDSAMTVTWASGRVQTYHKGL
ncbi:hypothetical protein D7294_21820 [Streptomyces hoynatensis]|uniref:Serine/threonine protein kinase n=1 Tax=Streptomyces hoynatensis TaxID=1141874 RepID=A0A3A9YVG0_9ACTN|nr:hypothetical protein D7294_21820 [Streptomyces hoynatensis]